MAATNRQSITVTRRARVAVIAATRQFTGDPTRREENIACMS
jgi:hypothetical protein